MRFCERIDLRKNISGQGDVDTNGFGLCVCRGDKNGHAGSIVPIGHDVVQRRRLGDGVAILGETVDMKVQGFLSHGSRVIETRPRGDDARKVRKGHTEVAVGVLMDKTNLVPHGSYLSSRPDWLSKPSAGQ